MILRLIKTIFGVGAVITTGLIGILLSFVASAISLTITLTIVYIFLAMAGVVPPQDFIPIVPFV